VLTGVVMVPVCVVSNRPEANIEVRMRRTCPSRVAMVTWPLLTASVSAVP